MDGLSVSRGGTATRPKSSIRKRCASPVLPPQSLQSTLHPDDPDLLELVFRTADEMKQDLLGERRLAKLLDGKIMASLFYEPSTRTRN